MDYAQATYVAKIESLEKRKITVKRLHEYGYSYARSPPRGPDGREGDQRASNAVFARQDECEKSRDPNLEAADIGADDETKLGLQGSPTQVVKVFSPPHREGGEKWNGEPEELAGKLAGLLKELEIV